MFDIVSRVTDSRLALQPTIHTAVWLVQLRWIAVIGQWLAIGLTHWGLGIRLPIVPLIALIGVTASSNLLFMYALSRVRQNPSDGTDHGDRLGNSIPSVRNAWLGSLLLLDILTLTGLLYFTGGMLNPFSCYFLANIVVGGLILSPPWSWTLTGMTILCSTFLLLYSPPLPQLGIDFTDSRGFFSVPIQGLFIAMGTCSGVIAYFITVLVRELRRREYRLVEAEEQRESAQRLEALATLAAGAGHELASPLSTIAVVAKELSRKVERTDANLSIRRDVELIKIELDRCREILQRMKSGAGEAAAEKMHDVAVQEFLDLVLTPLREPGRVEVVLDPALRHDAIRLPLQAASQAIRNLLQNALDASASSAKVAMHLERQDACWVITIIDRGAGMHEDTLRRIGQPFFTTKEVGQGMGLGVFLTRNVIHGLGGKIEFESQLGRGTSCRVTIPKRRRSLT